MILYRASDLIWASRIRATAEAVGVRVRPASVAALAEETPTALLVDLESGNEAMDVIAEVKRNHPGCRIIAFGPHVREDLFEMARRAGADEALPRGAFDHRLAEILRSV